MSECLVLPGIGGVAVQAILLICCIGVFYFKLRKEEEALGADARTRAEFLLDASKQFAGAGLIHLMNLGFATFLNSFTSHGDQCEWYWINIMVDTTLGTAVAYFLLQIAKAFIKKRFSPEAAEDFKSGDYKTEEGVIDFTRYMKQLLVWLVIVSCMKILMVMVMFIFSGPLLAVAGVVLAPFLTQPWLKLLVVMIVFPLIMDGFQIWIVDNFIQKKRFPLFSAETAAQDPEAGTVYVEASANALLNFSQRCEDVAETALLSLTARYHEAMHSDAHGERLHELPDKSGNFETQFKDVKFQTIIRPDQLESPR